LSHTFFPSLRSCCDALKRPYIAIRCRVDGSKDPPLQRPRRAVHYAGLLNK
jgi:hypothetical protein